jgi:CheY-like chemotaxis protein
MPAPLLSDRTIPAFAFHPGPAILLVDSQRALLESLGRRLEQQGYQTFAARQGAEALEIARSTQPQLILSDARLADMEAQTLCDHLAAEPETCHIPLIILSHTDRPDLIRRSRVAGCQYFVRKPFDARALFLLIGHAIEETPHAAV